MLRHSVRLFSSAANAELRAQIRKELDEIRSLGTFKAERLITSPQGTVITVNSPKGNKQVINFCANNYLGLSNDPRVVDAGKRAADRHGAGLSSVRFICGTQDIHRELELKIAKFHGKEDSILYAACFDANAGLFEVLLSSFLTFSLDNSPEMVNETRRDWIFENLDETDETKAQQDAVISDELNHASIIDGIRLCKAQKFRYRHLDIADLESQLKQAENCRRRLIVTDGAFSMDGDIAPLVDITRLAGNHLALVFIDECHATGFLGPTGRGTEELWGLTNKIDIINSTLGKALGGATGGYTTGPKEVIDLLRQKSRPYLFSNSLAPSMVGAALEVFKILEENPTLAQSVSRKARMFRRLMKSKGFQISGHQDHPICPVMIEDAKLASEFADKMLDEGIYVIGFSFPVVPRGKARIRVQISAAHDDEQIKHLADVFERVGKKIGFL